jgi:hypothetical protein
MRSSAGFDPETAGFGRKIGKDVPARPHFLQTDLARPEKLGVQDVLGEYLYRSLPTLTNSALCFSGPRPRSCLVRIDMHLAHDSSNYQESNQMSVSSVSTAGLSIPLSALSTILAQANQSTDGSNATATPPSGAPRGDLIASILGSLASIGAIGPSSTASATSGTGSTASTSSTSGATSSTAADFRSFVHSLLAALKSQSDSSSAQPTASGGTTNTGGATNSQGGNPGSGLASELNSLIQSLNSTSAASSTAASAADGTLQSSFNKLVADLGGSGSAASLTSFLQAFSTNIQSASALGNLVNGQA